MRLCVICFFFLASGVAQGQQLIGSFALGTTMVNVVKQSYGDRGLVFFNMHDNENTGVDAARKVLKKKGGVLYELVHSGERYIKFQLDSTEFLIDPNRIYTDTGVWRELERSGTRDSLAFSLVRSFAEALVDLMQLDEQALVITLHNNTDENYSAKSYMVGGEYETDAEVSFNGKKKDTDEFYFVTSAGLYGLLTPTRYNVVLQNNTDVTDDGSLSVYCGQRAIDYVNVEAQHGHKCANKKMLKRLLKQLDRQDLR